MNLFDLMIPTIEILIIAISIYYLLRFFWNTRAMDLMFGILALFVLYAASTWLQLPVLQKLMLYFVNVAVIAVLIIFQPEIRLALTKLSVKGRKFREITEFDSFVEGLAQAIYHLAEKRHGALVVLENQDTLDEYANKSVLMNAAFTPELLESIFSPTTPLHDGAVIVRGTMILSAATILPLADDSKQITRAMGTRHRAGLGISQLTDALIIVVSEQTGKVSISRDGIMTRGIKEDRFKGIIRSVFTPPKSAMESNIDFVGLVKQWTQ